MDANYIKSNKIISINLPISEDARVYAKILTESFLEPERPARLASESVAGRQKFGEALLDELSDAAEIDVVKLKISPARQFHKRFNNKIVSKQYGYYRPDTHYIYIYNRTAVQGKTLAPKTFLDTLLHEWMHHYDFKKLSINSIHTTGFYKRLACLKEKLGL